MSVAGCVLLVLRGPGAAAQTVPPAPTDDARAQSVESAPSSNQIERELPVESPRSVKLFDSAHTTRSTTLELGPIWYRPRNGSTEGFGHGTGEVTFGVATTTRWSPFYIFGLQQTIFRAFDSKSFAWSLLAAVFGAGLALGPIEPEVRVGASLLTLDVFHGDFSAEMLSPRVGAGVGIRMGKIRLDFQAHSEYLWRWFGQDYLIHGASIGLRVEIPRPKSLFSDTAPR